MVRVRSSPFTHARQASGAANGRRALGQGPDYARECRWNRPSQRRPCARSIPQLKPVAALTGPRGLYDRRKAVRGKRRAAHQRAVDIRLCQQTRSVAGLHRAPILDSDAVGRAAMALPEPVAYVGVYVLRLGWRCGAAGADGPDRLIGNCDRGGKLATVTFNGVMKVSNPARLIELLEKGVGPAKGFGCGLLLVRRI